jgi:hypothetical protein
MDIDKHFNKVSVFFLLLCLLLMTLSFVGKKTGFANNNINNKIVQKMAFELAKCGEGYYFSYIAVRDDFLKKELSFIDEIGYKEGDKEPSSVKFNNPHWSKIISIDAKSYSFLNSRINNQASYYSQLKQLSDVPIAQMMIHSSNVRPVAVGFTIVKKYYGIIYVFILTKTNPKSDTCGKYEFTSILNNVSNFTEGLLW